MIKKIITGLLSVLSVVALAQYNDTIYINPESSGFEDGSMAHPYNDIFDVEITSNTCYLVKRGTAINISNPISLANDHDVKISAYESGNRPLIQVTDYMPDGAFNIERSQRIIIENLDIRGFVPNAPNSAVKIVGHYITGHTEDILVKNCNIERFFNGVRMFPANVNSSVTKVTVDGCTIHHISEDGVFGQYIDKLTVRNTHIYHVNLDWHYQGHTEELAPGDCIQLSYDSDDFLIENCILDRRFTGLKFCFIHNSDNGGYGNDGIIRDCIFYPPKDTVGAGSAGGAWFFHDGDSLTIERCIVVGRERIYSYDAGVAGDISFDHVILRNILGDSVHNLKTTNMNETCLAEHLTFVSNRPNSKIVNLSGGNTILRNSAIAGNENNFPTYGITTIENCHIYQGNDVSWGSEFGWVNWSGGNYQLLENSPLIDQGTASGSTFDLNGTIVPQGIAPDIGSYEYGSNTVVNPLLPEADFISDAQTIYEGQEVGFTDQSGNDPSAWHWYFPGGKPELSNEQNPVIQYTEPGVFPVTLIVLNNDGQDIEQRSEYIEVLDNYNSPVAGFSSDKQAALTGESVSFINQSLYLPKNFIWYFEGGTPSSSTEINPEIRYYNPGAFDVKLGVVNDHGNDIEFKDNFIQITENFNSPLADFSVETGPHYANESVQFTDESLNIPYQWYWYFEGAVPTVSVDRNPAVIYSQPGSYKVRLFVSNSNGFDIKEVDGFITINE